MKPWLWQRLMFVFALVALAHVGFDFASVFVSGGPGFTGLPEDSAHGIRYRIVTVTNPERSVPPVRVGDVVRLETSTLMERMRYGDSRIGARFIFVRQDDTRFITTLGYDPPSGFDYTFALVRLSMIAIGMLLVLRRPQAIETRTLATFLLFFGFAIGPAAQPFFPDIFLLVEIYVQQSMILLALAQAVRLATVFPDPNAGGLRARIRTINPFVTALYVVTLLSSQTTIYLLNSHIPHGFAILLQTSTAYYVIAIVIAFTLANRRAVGAEKARVGWVSYSLAVGFSGVVVESIAYTTGHAAWWLNFFALTLIAIPLGLAYAIARHRVIDVGFVLNRALVFAAISAIVVVTFGVLEWLLGKYLLEVGHVTSASLEIGLALLLGASLRQIHRRVERVADDIFFRARHRAEAALRRFALDAQYITNLRTIFERTIDEVRTYGEARECALYMVDGLAFERCAGSLTLPERLDENDALIVRLRATREPVDIHDVPSAIAADIAFPFIVRGAISGALVCGAKSSGEAYAPDERAALAEVARSVGIASDTLYTEALRAEIEAVMGSRPTLGSARDLLLRSATGGAESAL